MPRPLIPDTTYSIKFSKGKRYAHNEITEKVKVQKMQPVTKKVDGERVWLKNDDGSLMYCARRRQSGQSVMFGRFRLSTRLLLSVSTIRHRSQKILLRECSSLEATKAI